VVVGGEGDCGDVGVGLEFRGEGGEGAEDWRVRFHDGVVDQDADAEGALVCLGVGAELKGRVGQLGLRLDVREFREVGMVSFAYQSALRAVHPWHGDERWFVEPGFLVDERFHEDFDSFEAGAQRAYDGDDLFLTKHRCRETVKRQSVRGWLEAE